MFDLGFIKDIRFLLRRLPEHDQRLNLLFSATRVLTPTAVFLRVEGGGSANVVVDGGDLGKAATPVTLGAGAAQAQVKVRA